MTMAEDRQRAMRDELQRGVFQAGRAEITEEMKRRLEFAPKPTAGARIQRVRRLGERA